MSTTPISSYKFLQKLHPLSLLAQLNGRRATGLLRVFTEEISWSIYLEEGKLTYASYSDQVFDRLEKHLQQALQQTPTLNTATIIQVRSIFDLTSENQSIPNADYQAICWLVNQRAISHSQAGMLIEELAKEALSSFLSLKQGSYEFYPEKTLDELPRFSRLDLRALVEYCQGQLRRENFQSPTSEVAASPVIPRVEVPKTEAQAEIKQEEPTQTNLNTDDDHSNYQSSQRTGKNPYTVACIDDSPTVLASIKHFLDENTFSVVMINDPVKALMQILRSKPDLILLDVEMPNLDGYELCSLLRRHSAFKNTPIIMVTGRTGFIDRAKAKMVRSSGYLTKPFTQSDLMKMVFKHLA
jgi:two-component system, chemotaxis family, response regulator PixG